MFAEDVILSALADQDSWFVGDSCCCMKIEQGARTFWPKRLPLAMTWDWNASTMMPDMATDFGDWIVPAQNAPGNIPIQWR